MKNKVEKNKKKFFLNFNFFFNKKIWLCTSLTINRDKLKKEKKFFKKFKKIKENLKLKTSGDISQSTTKLKFLFEKNKFIIKRHIAYTYNTFKENYFFFLNNFFFIQNM